MTIRSIRHVVVVALITSALFTSYFYLITNGKWQFAEYPKFLRYDMLAEAFLSGQLQLRIPPHPGRIQARDPTDPGLPYPFIFDAVIWDGKHYFTQDPAPALLHALVILLTGTACPTGFMVILFATGSLLGLWLILRMVQQAYAPQQPWTLWLTWLSFGLSGAQLFMVSRPAVYHEAIAAGMFFIILGTYCFLWCAVRQKHIAWLSVAAFLWGLGVASRVTLVFYPVIFVLCGLYLAIRQHHSTRSVLSSAVALAAPVAATVVLLLLYNYVRFGDLLDFGRTHITVPDKHFYVYLSLMDNSFRLAHVPFNLYHYLVALPEFSLYAPFILHPDYAVVYSADVLMGREKVSSLLFMMPILLFAVPNRSLIRRLWQQPSEAVILAAGVLGSGATFWLLLFYYRAVSRYLFEFTPLLFPLILCNLAVWWDDTETSPARRRALLVGIAIVFALQVFAGACLGLNGLGP